jgi:primosomal protein N' (replication factor Y)
MHVISVIPIARGVTHDFLSYISAESLEPGSVIHITLRNKPAFGIVLSCRKATDARSEIRGSDFEYKKLEDPAPRKVLPPPLMEILPPLAEYFAASAGSVLATLVPKYLLSAHEGFDEQPEYERHPLPKEVLALQEDEDDRFAHYKSAVRERFARGGSVMFVVPSAEDAERIALFMKKGIEQRTIIIGGKKTAKALSLVWNAIARAKEPILIITTPNLLMLPRRDVSLIIVERESARSYKSQSRPFVDSRIVAERYARACGADILFGDIALRPEMIERIEKGEVHEYAPLSMRSLSTAKSALIDMTRKEGEKFAALSPELEDLVRSNKEKSQLAFVFAGRRGLAGNTVCQDCATALTCDRCSAALTLYGKDDRRFFLCNKCGRRFPSEMKCPVCQSWRLVSLGVGTERVEEALKEKIEGIKVFRLDRSSATTPARAKKIAEEWLATPGSVLVGTESAIPYISRPIDSVAVASLDALFALPDFHVEERVFSIILSLRSRARNNILIQTRFPNRKIIEYGLKGNIAEYMRDERAARKSLGFPPFSTFIKISYIGKRPEAEAAIEEVRAIASPYPVDIFPALIASVKNQFIMHALIILPLGAWVDEKLLAALRSLSPRYSVNVDPDSIL